MKQKLKVVVVYGGPGNESQVSIKSGENILKNIDSEKYNVESLLLSKNHKKLSAEQIKFLKEKIVFPVMHGMYGEGGDFQKELERNKIKFIGSGSKVSKICIDKGLTQKILEKNNIRVAKSIVLKSYRKINLNFPVILKQVDGGSSVDIRKCYTEVEYKKEVNFLLKKYGKVLAQEFVEGREFTCSVMQTVKGKVMLPVSEVVLTDTKIFDYEAKYTGGKCLEVTPAKIDNKLKGRIQKISKKVYEVLEAKDLGRVDMIMDKKGRIFVLEINTMPGMTMMSFLPQQLESFYGSFGVRKFIDIMIENNIK